MRTQGAAQAFDESPREYDTWYEENKSTFLSELALLQKIVPSGIGVEIGAGTGIFARHFQILAGIDPSRNMLKIAQKRGTGVVQGVGEALPFKNETFDFALFITAFCFVQNPGKAHEEAHRVLKNGGEIIIAIIDKNSHLGKKYELKKDKNKFYRAATFYSPGEIEALLKSHDFKNTGTWQTLFENADPKKVQNSKKGSGDGGFVAIKARR
jgi:ubiquinone/menaquinone biosynthesis C-methylase UbiE